jgi:putative hydrolase of the HAD superfamily
VTAEAFPSAIFLDLDDTILDDSGNIDSAWLTACQEAAVDAPSLDAALLVSAIQEVRTWYWSDAERHRVGRSDLRLSTIWIVEEALRRCGIEIPGFGYVIANRYRDLREKGQALLPGAIEAVEFFRAAGTRLALLTNGSAVAQRAKIERFDLARYFDYICIEGEFGCGKPDERVYLGALDALNVAPQDAWMVGDNLELDVIAPMQVGLRGIWLDRFGTGLPATAKHYPDRIILGLGDLLERP